MSIPNTPIHLNAASFDKAIASSTPIIVDFWAQWCGPCKAFAPTLDQVAATGAPVGKVDIDDNMELATRYNVRAVPTVIIFKNGEPKDTFTGVRSKEDILARWKAAAA